jgi:predicted dehydrogenase
MSEVSQCRWGILGTAFIAHKHWRAFWNVENATLSAVASRSLENAQKFVNECQSLVPYADCPAAVGSYEELLHRDDVDAVYIPLPTGLRKPWVIQAAEAGKHVLAEKPAGVTAADVAEMIAACKQNGVQFMDGVMFMHSRRLDLLRSVLSSSILGDLRRIVSHFTFSAPEAFLTDNIRLHSELEPAGCLGDLGWYCMRMILWTMQGRLPKRVTARVLTPLRRNDSPTAVPGEFSAELFFDGGVSAAFYCSFLTENQQWVTIGGSKGFVSIYDFVLPCVGAEAEFFVTRDIYNANGCDFNMERHIQRFAVNEYAGGTADSQEANMIRTFSKLVLSGKTDDSWPQWALSTQTVLDACVKSARADGAMVSVGG